MLITYFRSSSFGTYQLCQQQYFLEYGLGIPEISNKKADMGTIVHKVMECLAAYKLAMQEGKDHFMDGNFGRVEVRPDRLMSEELVREFFGRSCVYYIHKSDHDFCEKDKALMYKWCWMVLDNETFDPRRRTVFMPELKFDFVIEEPWAYYQYENGPKGYLGLKGTIDLITQLDHETLEVVDWKTGQRKDWGTGKKKDYEYLCSDFQLSMYYYALRRNFPQFKSIIMSIYWVRDGGPFTMAYGPEHEDRVVNTLRETFHEIQKNVRPRLRYGGKDWFCNRVCHYGKNMSPKEPTKTICQYIANKTKTQGMDTVIHEDTQPGHHIDHYEDPGA